MEDSGRFTDVKKELSTRRKFVYNWRDTFHYFVLFGWLYRWRRKQNNSNTNDRNNKHRLLNMANKRLKQELDVSDLILTLRTMKGLISVLLNRDQQLLLELQKIHVLDDSQLTCTKSQVNDDEVGVKYVPSSSNKVHILDLLNTKDSNTKSDMKQLLYKALLRLDLKNSPIDRRLYRSLFLNTSIELQNYMFEARFDNKLVTHNDDLESSQNSALYPIQGKAVVSSKLSYNLSFQNSSE